MKKKFLILIMLILMFALPVFADTVPYHCYNYDHYGKPVETPAPYKPITQSSDIGGLINRQFNQPADIFVAKNGDIYVLDSGNGKIEVFNSSLAYLRTIDGFMKSESEADSLKNPEGIFVTDIGDIYIADTQNGRIVVLDNAGGLKFYIAKVESELLDSGFEFLPSKLAVDDSGRLYVVANRVFQGIMMFEINNRFSNFIGTVDVTVTPIELFWRRFSTKAQREKSKLFVPTEFSNLDIDSEGFIYTSNIDLDSGKMIKRLNPYGVDVLKNHTEHKLAGDLLYSLRGDLSGPTQFCDVTVRKNGMYSALDSVRGRVFTYDDEGHILHIFGGFGTQTGSFKKPVAIDSSDGKLLVLDQEQGRVMVFEHTEYGHLIEGAVSARFLGEDEKSIDFWQLVLKQDPNYELAYSGIGRSLLAEYRNKEAMEYLKKGHDTKYYSIAFKRYRLDMLKDNVNMVINAALCLFLVSALWVAVRKILKQRKNQKSKKDPVPGG